MWKATRPSFGTFLAGLLLAATTALYCQTPVTGPTSQSASSSASQQGAEGVAAPAGGGAPAQGAGKAEHEVTINAPDAGPVMPVLPPDKFTDCLKKGPGGVGAFDAGQAAICQMELQRDKRIVVEACVNADLKASAARVVQACTELLDQNLFEGRDRFFLFANRSKGYVGEGDTERALDDLNEAIKLAPRDADLFYDRGLFYAGQLKFDPAMQDFDTALGINAKLAPALQQRARIHQFRNDFDGAVIDYTEAIRLQPKSAVLWSERGYVSLRARHFDAAVQDETQAITLDPKLAKAYYLRGSAYGNLGDAGNASSDIKTAVGLDAGLARYIVIQGKNVSLTLPPL